MARPENLPPWIEYDSVLDKIFVKPGVFSVSEIPGVTFHNKPFTDTSRIRGDPSFFYGIPVRSGYVVTGTVDAPSRTKTVTKALASFGVGAAISTAFNWAFGSSTAAASETTAATAASTEGASMSLENWTDFGSASDAASTANTIPQTPSFWDRMVNAGGNLAEFAAKQAIQKEIFGDNQQPISTQAKAGTTPLNNPIPERGFDSRVPNFIPARADMGPFLWLGVTFGAVVIFLLAFSRR